MKFPSTRGLPVTVTPTLCSSLTGRTRMNYGAFEEVSSEHRGEGHSHGGFELVKGGHGRERTQ